MSVRRTCPPPPEPTTTAQSSAQRFAIACHLNGMTLFDPRVLGAAPSGLRRERIQSSPRFKNGRFHNTEPVSDPMNGQPLAKRASIMGEFFFGRESRTPGGLVPVESPLAAWA